MVSFVCQYVQIEVCQLRTTGVLNVEVTYHLVSWSYKVELSIFYIITYTMSDRIGYNL